MREPRFKAIKHWDGTFDVYRADGALLGADLSQPQAEALAARYNEEHDEAIADDHAYHDIHHPECPICATHHRPEGTA